MHIPFAPRELLFSFFKQLAVPTGGWQKKKLAEGGYMYVFFFHSISRSKSTVGKDKRDTILWLESSQMKNLSMKS